MADAYQLETGTDRYLLEDGTGVYLLDIIPINWLRGASFEVAGDEAYWTLVAGTGSLVRATDGGLSDGSCRLVAGDTGTSLKKVRYSHQLIPVTVGLDYTFQSRITCLGSGSGRVNIVWLQSDGTTVQATTNGSTVGIGGATDGIVTAAAPSGAAYGQPEYEGLSTTNSSLWLDRVMFEQASTAQTWTITYTNPAAGTPSPLLIPPIRRLQPILAR